MVNIVKIRGLISLSLVIVFIIESFTGVGLYFAPSGKVARETSWTFAGFDRPKLENMHTLWGFVMIGLISVHFVLNYKMLINEIKILLKKG